MTEAAQAVTNAATNVVTLDPVLGPQDRANLGKLPTPLMTTNLKIRMVFEALLNHCFEQCNDALFKAADSADTAELQNQLFDANRRVRDHHTRFCQHFLGGVDMAFSQLMASANDNQGSHATRRSYPASDEISPQEPSSWTIRLESLENDALAQNGNRIASISTRIGGVLAAMRDNDDAKAQVLADNQANPLHPAIIIGLFNQQVMRLALPPRAAQCMADVFQMCLIDQLASIYDAVDRLLDQAGVPKAKEFDSNFTSKYISQLNMRQTKEAAPANETTMAILNSVLGTPKTSKVVSRKDLLRILDVAQRELGNATAIEASATMMQLLAQTQSRMKISGELSNYDSELIKLIGVMFEVVTRNDNLELLVKRYVNRLQVAVIKIALLDNSFFAKASHPARCLLNELVMAGLGWQQSQDPDLKSENIRIIEKITSNIVENFGTDTTTFVQALNLLRKTLNNERQELSLLGIRLHGSAQGKAKSIEAENAVDAIIGSTLKTASATPIVRAFANKLWRKVMLVTAMRDSITSSRWHNQTRLLDALCHLTTPCTTADDKTERCESLPKVMQQIQQAITTCTHNAFDTAEILEELHRTLCECLRGNPAPAQYAIKNAHEHETPTPGSVEITREREPAGPKSRAPATKQSPNNKNQPASVQTTAADGNTAPEPESAADALLREQIMQFPRGALFNWEEPQKGKIRCQLAAVIKQSNRYIFINRNGIKVIDMAIDEVMSAVKNHQLIPIDNNMVFDKALEEVVSGLRRSQSGPIDNKTSH
ncbi:MAG TPA: DUF1631 family protein [Marinagarivorans sp.]